MGGQRRTKDFLTPKVRRGHATPHMSVEMAKCWWLLKIEPNVWAGGKGSCAVWFVLLLELVLAHLLGDFSNRDGVACPLLPSGVDKPLVERVAITDDFM